MAGFRLSPKAARARRWPWRRRRRVWSAPAASVSQQSDAADQITISDVATHSGAASANTAQGGLVWLFVQGSGAPISQQQAAADSITVSDSASSTTSGATHVSQSASDTITVTSAAVVSLVPGVPYILVECTGDFTSSNVTSADLVFNDTSGLFNPQTPVPA